MNREEKERIPKFCFCAGLGLALSKLLGKPGSPTIAISAVLMLHLDRGYHDSLLYSLRRTMAQLVIGAIELPVILAALSVFSSERWIAGLIAAVVGMAVGLPLEYRLHFVPLTCSLGNAALILADGITDDPWFYVQRVGFCAIGGIVAYFVNFIVMPRHDRYKETLDRLCGKSRELLEIPLNTSPAGLAGQITEDLAAVDKNIVIIEKDRHHRGYRVTDEQMRKLQVVRRLLDQLLELRKTLEVYPVDPQGTFSAQIQETYDYLSTIHQCFLTGDEKIADLPDYLSISVADVHSEEQLHILHEITLYRDLIKSGSI